MRPAPAAALLLTFLLGAPAAGAQETPLVAGSDGVPVPRKSKDQKPLYPAEAIARGLRGIVILDLVIDEQGRVAAVTVVRSVPGLDEAAVAAARRWQYEPVRLRNRAVSVHLTVPVSFSLELPRLERAAEIPELRQGANPVLPSGSSGKGSATAEVTLDPDGGVGSTQLVTGEEPWAGALLGALKSWRFAPPPENATVTFRVEAEFLASRVSGSPPVILRANGLRRADLLGTPLPVAEPPAPTAPQVSAATPPPAAAPPPVEVITVPPPPSPPENGISTVRDVSLESGVPDLTRGRRPVPPPLARLAGASGSVEVDFSVGAAGSTVIREVSGPELLKQAARQAVASWVFRRTRADRAYLLAVFTYSQDRAGAVVRPQAAPGGAPAPAEPQPIAGLPAAANPDAGQPAGTPPKPE